MTMPAAPCETELKLSFRAEDEAAIAAHAALRPPRAGPAAIRQLKAAYYDTASGALAASGFSLRVRRGGAAPVQTLKSRGADAPIAVRGEWQWTLAEERPDPALLAATPAAGFATADLCPVIETQIRRETRIIELHGTACIEAALDIGEIRAGGQREAVHELELELKSGDPGALYRLALELHADLPLCLETRSKAERGEALLRPAAPPIIRPAPPAFAAGADAGSAFRAIIAAGLGGLAANQPAARAGLAEGVHQMRVALRRLRTALVLFGPYLDPVAAGYFASGLRGLAQLLGRARDWDVFCGELLPAIFADPAHAGWRAMVATAAELQREAAYDALWEELGGKRPTGLILSLGAWSHEPDLLAPAARVPIDQIAPKLLDRLDRKLRRRARHAGRLDDAGLHDLRKTLKKLRYAVEFMAPIYPRKQVHKFAARCKDLQERLGAYNDAAVGEALAQQLAANAAAYAAPLAQIGAWAGGQRASARKGLGHAAARLARGERFWAR